MALTRDKYFSTNDIAIKEIPIPPEIPIWGGETVFIKQLSRGDQDEYLRRQYGQTRMKQDVKAKQQEISAVNIYGHDAWLMMRGCVDAEGRPLFKEADIPEINKKAGAFVGWVASEIVKFSKMEDDIEEDVKNS